MKQANKLPGLPFRASQLQPGDIVLGAASAESPLTHLATYWRHVWMYTGSGEARPFVFGAHVSAGDSRVITVGCAGTGRVEPLTDLAVLRVQCPIETRRRVTEYARDLSRRPQRTWADPADDDPAASCDFIRSCYLQFGIALEGLRSTRISRFTAGAVGAAGPVRLAGVYSNSAPISWRRPLAALQRLWVRHVLREPITIKWEGKQE